MTDQELSEALLLLQTQAAALEHDIAELRAQVEEPDPPVDPPVDPEPPVEPEPPIDPPVDPLPGTGEKIRVANGPALTTILARKDIKPGTTLALHPDGDFPGTYTLYNSGADSGDRAIFVVAEQASAGRRTKVTGRFIVRGSNVKLSGFDFSGSGRKVEIWGRSVRVNRCRFTGIRYDGIVYLMGTGFPEAQVDRCEFRDFAGAAVRGELKDVSKSKNIKIHRNLFLNHSTLSGNESVVLILTDAFNMGNVQYHRNLFERCLLNNDIGQQEIISVKTGGAGITENTIVSTEGFISLRETSSTRVVGNWFDAKSFVKVHGDDHTLVNNRGENVVLELNCGDEYVTTNVPVVCRNNPKAGRTTLTVKSGNCKVAHCGTRRAVAEHNVGRVVIGNKNDERYGYTKPAQGLKLRHNATKAERIGGIYPDTVETDVGDTNNTARKLTYADVGIKAP